ncbi:hypothetical protein PR048_015779 [Dryococelus australis]|uniref:Uncharacterized protein n=1 Tax=Dryococelus australis TaxID=614101 RepID=A0ABQ9HHY4_9NEOP|nr:hypothetical protein PR048_015779 [Dryococelus australis]
MPVRLRLRAQYYGTDCPLTSSLNPNRDRDKLRTLVFAPLHEGSGILGHAVFSYLVNLRLTTRRCGTRCRGRAAGRTRARTSASGLGDDRWREAKRCHKCRAIATADTRICLGRRSIRAGRSPCTSGYLHSAGNWNPPCPPACCVPLSFQRRGSRVLQTDCKIKTVWKRLTTHSNSRPTVAQSVDLPPVCGAVGSEFQSQWLDYSPPTEANRIFACGNRAGLCRWLTGFLGDIPFTPPLHSGASPYSPRFIVPPKFSTPLHFVRRIKIVYRQSRNHSLCKCRISITKFSPDVGEQLTFGLEGTLFIRSDEHETVDLPWSSPCHRPIGQRDTSESCPIGHAITDEGDKTKTRQRIRHGLKSRRPCTLCSIYKCTPPQQLVLARLLTTGYTTRFMAEILDVHFISGGVVMEESKFMWGYLYDSVSDMNNVKGGSSGAVVSALVSHHGDPGPIPGGFAPGFSHVGIVLDDATCRRALSGNTPGSPALELQRRSIPAPHLMSCSGMTGT